MFQLWQTRVPLLSGRALSTLHLMWTASLVPISALAVLLARDTSLGRFALAFGLWLFAYMLIALLLTAWAHLRGLPLSSPKEQKDRIRTWADQQPWWKFALTYAVPTGALLGIGVHQMNTGHLIWATSLGEWMFPALAQGGAWLVISKLLKEIFAGR